MGQRLVIQILDKDNKNIATSYYHWSGFTESAIQLSKKVINDIANGIDCVRALKNTGAKLQGETGINRNDGLIDVGEAEMKNSVSWNEQLIVIYLNEKQKIRFIDIDKLFHRESDISDFKLYSKLNDEERKNINIEYSCYDTIENTNKFFDKILNLYTNKQYYFFYYEEYYKMIY